MPPIGQASGGFTESSSAFRILNQGIKNALGNLTDDSFYQTNPCALSAHVSSQADTGKLGVLSGSVAFTRPDAGGDMLGGPGSAATQSAIAANPALAIGFKALGVFLNSANGNAYENLPAVASGKNTYACGMGTYGNQLFETEVQVTVGAATAGDALVYVPGVKLIASRNGFFMPQCVVAGGAIVNLDTADNSAESFVAAAPYQATVIGVLKMAADASQNELVYDQRI